MSKGYACVNATSRRATSRGKFVQRGQGIVEFAVAATFFLVPLLIGMTWLARVESSRQHLHQAARYAAWERTVWYRSGNDYVTKSDSNVSFEVTKRVLARATNAIDSRNDKTAVDTRSDKLDSFLYTADYSRGRTLPMFKPNTQNNSRDGVSYRSGAESNAIATVLNRFGSLLGLRSEGIATSTVSADLEVVPAIKNLNVLPATFTSSAKNALLGGAWSANGIAGEEKAIKRVVPAGFIDQIPGWDILQSGIGFIFPEFNTFDPGHVDAEITPCQRVYGVSSKC